MSLQRFTPSEDGLRIVASILIALVIVAMMLLPRPAAGPDLSELDAAMPVTIGTTPPCAIDTTAGVRGELEAMGASRWVAACEDTMADAN